MTGKIKLAILRVVFAAAAAFAQTSATDAKAPPKAALLTFNKNIAPIIFQSCAECHHPGGPAPFSLLSYEDVKKRAKQIATVTKSRYMPPWPPEPGYGEFIGERRLTDEQIRSIQHWVQEGAVEGVRSPVPSAPKFSEGWQLGQPDLVMKAAQAYTLPAGGPDVFRNFVIPVPVSSPRYVKAVEILPGNKKIVHHANILIDRSGWSRRRDEQDPEVGFGGMDVATESESFEPDSHFLFWKPGTPPHTEPDDMAWQVDKATDLVLNMHLQPSGKPEAIQPSVGLYFSDRPPARFPMLLQLERDGALDIPAGKKDFEVTDEFQLPVDVDVLAVYPHAHYLGKDLQGFATLPDGTKKWLIWIKDWDINWQAVYRYSKPIFLPSGTVLSMRYSYDNSAENVRNPNHPPKRVVAGNRSSDEMSHLWIQVLPRAREDVRIILQEALMRQRLKKYPADFSAHFNLGSILLSQAKPQEAISHFREALRAKPDDAVAHTNLGAALQSIDKLEEADSHFREALRIRPDYINARYNLGNLLLSKGNPEEAIIQFNEVLRGQPDDADAHNNLGEALAIQGNLDQAFSHFEQALRINPDHPEAKQNLKRAQAQIKSRN
ncbi:MAG TPA: tetratricopeptide repeat protein [Blastocatellia bacterium]|nr:tetratricopeptide repeat protein [Blastocatellia bacterium]